MTPQRYQPSFPQTDNRLPLNQLAYDRSYNNPYLNQPLNYPGLLSTGPSLSTLNPTADMLGQYPSPLRGKNRRWTIGCCVVYLKLLTTKYSVFMLYMPYVRLRQIRFHICLHVCHILLHILYVFLPVCLTSLTPCTSSYSSLCLPDSFSYLLLYIRLNILHSCFC